MRTKKLLSLILTLCLVFTTIGSITVVNAENVTITETYNLAQGTTYELPAGAIVDISNPGYQIVQDTDGKWYRVNVGTYDVIMYDDMEGHKTTMNSDGVSGTTSVGKINNLYNLYIAHPKVGNDGNTYTQKFENVNGNSVLSLGKWTDWVKWQLADTAKPTGSFRVSYDMKVERYNLSTVPRGTLTFRTAFTDGAANSHSIFYLRLYMTSDKNSLEGNKMTIRPYGANSSGGGDINISPDYEITTDQAGENILTTDWINVLFDVQADGKFKIFIDGTDVTTGTAKESTYVLGENFKLASVDFYNNGKGEDTKFLVNNIKITTNTPVYPSAINGEGLTDSVYSGIKSGSVSVPVTMSDDTTQNFTATYTLTDAQTAAAGTYNVEATIPGFSEKVTVAVTVNKSAAANKSINTYQNATITFPTQLDSMDVSWKNYSGNTVSTADTTKIGRKLYTGTLADGRTVTYTVNIGEYSGALTDNMNHNENKDTISTSGYIVDPVSKPGFVLEVLKPTAAEPATFSVESETLTNGTMNNFITIGPGTANSGVAKWNVIESGFNGGFKMSAKVRVDQYILPAATQSALTLKAFTHVDQSVTNDTGELLNFTFRLAASPTSGNSIRFYGQGATSAHQYYINDLISEKYTDSETGTKYYYTKDWIEVEIYGNESSYDAYVNGNLVFSGMPYYNGRTGNLSHCVATQRTSATNLPSALFSVDDLSVERYSCFTDTLDSMNISTSVGSNTAKVPLILSNGSSKKFDVTVDADVSKIANIQNADVTITGFDGTIDANVKVCNYDVTGVNIKNGSEFVTAPVPGAIIESVVMRKLTDETPETVIVALYGSDDTIKAIKTAELSGIIFKNDKDGDPEGTAIPVNMELPESTVNGDYIRVYVWDSKANIQPIDMVTDIAFDYTAAPNVYIAAASCFETYSRAANPSQWPKTGIGQALVNYLDEEVAVVNVAKSGASTHSFKADGLWDRILYNIKSGDYVIISFGHNDQVDCTDETHPSGCVYGTNLQYFIDSAREKGANPIFVTPVVRRDQAIAGTLDTTGFNSTLHKHIDQMISIANDDKNNVPLIDMTNLSETKLLNLGDTKSKELYMIDLVSNMSEYTSNPLWETSRYNPDGKNDVAGYKADNTHFNLYGANVYAQMLANAIKDNYPDIQLTKHLTNLTDTISYPFGTIQD